jgi:hypothetical protein
LLVSVVHALVRRVVGQVMQQMSDVVQQGRRHERRTGAGLAGEMGGLQSVLALRDRLAAIAGAAALAKHSQNLLDDFTAIA